MHVPEGAEEKHDRQDSRSEGRDMNPAPLELEAGMLITRPRCSVPVFQYGFLLIDSPI